MMKHSLLVLAFATALPVMTQAAEYKALDKDKSAITFTYQQMGVGMDGKFKSFTADLDFDPAKPEAGHAVIDVALASIDAGSDEANDEVVGKQWFNAEQFPSAKFESKSITSTGAGQYLVKGALTIKGKSIAVDVPATFKEENGEGLFSGKLTIHRGDFSIGEGSWSTFDVVANDIEIQFTLAAK